MSLVFIIIALLMLWKGGDEAAIIAWPMLIISGIMLFVKIKERIDFDNHMALLESQRNINLAEEAKRNEAAQKIFDELNSKTCFSCAETIKKEAKKCRFCGELQPEL